MITITMCTLPDLWEVEVNPEDIEIKNEKYFVNGVEHSITCPGMDKLELYYLGAQRALNKEINKKQVNEALNLIKKGY